jgi:hypothetical protein
VVVDAGDDLDDGLRHLAALTAPACAARSR